MDTKGSDQVKAACHGACNCANGVDGIESAQIGTRRGEPPDHEPREHRQRRAHEKGRYHDQTKGEHETRSREHRFGMTRDLVECEIGGRNSQQQKMYGERRETNPDFQEGIEAQRIGVPVRDFSEQPTPQRESRHERCQHDTHGNGRCSEHMREHSYPDDLVDEAAGAGEEKQG